MPPVREHDGRVPPTRLAALLDPRASAARKKLTLEQIARERGLLLRPRAGALLEGVLGCREVALGYLDVDPYVVGQFEPHLPATLDAVGTKRSARTGQEGAQPRVAGRGRVVAPERLRERRAADRLSAPVGQAREDDPGLAAGQATIQAFTPMLDGEAATQANPELSHHPGWRNHHGGAIVLPCEADVNRVLRRPTGVANASPTPISASPTPTLQTWPRPCGSTLPQRWISGFSAAFAWPGRHSPVPRDAWERPMAARVVRFLLVQRGAVPEDQLLEAFWHDRDPVAAHRCLAVALSRCRAVLHPGAIDVNERAYRLVLGSRDTVDADLFEAAAGAALGSRPDRHGRRARTGRCAWEGEPLPEDRYADWSRDGVTRLPDRHRELLAALADAYAKAGDHGAALCAARRMLAADSLDEGAHRRVMAAYAALGRRNRALEQYLCCRRELIDAVGIEPSRETSALQALILAGAEAGVAA